MRKNVRYTHFAEICGNRI